MEIWSVGGVTPQRAHNGKPCGPQNFPGHSSDCLILLHEISLERLFLLNYFFMAVQHYD